MTIRLLLGMESGSTTHSPGAILNLSPALEADLVSTNRATWVTPPALTVDAGKPVQAVTSPGGGNRLLAGNLPADMAQLSNVVVSDGALQSWTANGIDYVATYAGGKVATVTTADGWVQTYTWVGDVPTITVAQV